MSSIEAADSSSEAGTAPTLSEDWLSVVIGLAIFAVALVSISRTDLLGWVVTTSVWADPSKALGAA